MARQADCRRDPGADQEYKNRPYDYQGGTVKIESGGKLTLNTGSRFDFACVKTAENQAVADMTVRFENAGTVAGTGGKVTVVMKYADGVTGITEEVLHDVLNRVRDLIGNSGITVERGSLDLG